MAGSVRATEAELEAFTDPSSGAPSPVLLFVGRFLGFKRVPLLLRAYARFGLDHVSVTTVRVR